MKKITFLICYTLIVFASSAQYTLSSTFYKEYVDEEEKFLCDSSIINNIRDNTFYDRLKIKECGMILNHLKQDWWDCYDENGNLVCQRYYSEGNIIREIRYSENKITSFVDFNIVPEIIDDWTDISISKKRKYFLSINFLITFDENGKLKTKYSYDHDKHHNIETVY